MSKAVLISIRPKWCELIASGQKTVEVRKTVPKLGTPYKCYIYCTKAKEPFMLIVDKGSYQSGTTSIATSGGKVIGEFICDQILEVSAAMPWIGYYAGWNTCLTDEEIVKYAGYEKPVYCWHISNLKIYDDPKPITMFLRPCPNEGPCALCKYAEINPKDEILDCMNRVERPPQSWCYVERRSV